MYVVVGPSGLLPALPAGTGCEILQNQVIPRTRALWGTGRGCPLLPSRHIMSGVSVAGAACWLPNQGVALSCAGMPVVLSQEAESVLVGAAVLGACASGDFTSVQVCEDQGVGHGSSPV